MTKDFNNENGLIARLTISALSQIRNDDPIWRDPIVHKAILISGLSVLIQCVKYLDDDLSAF